MTSSVSGKRSPAELIAPGNQKAGGGDGNRTRVHGFAGRCLTTRPLHRWGPRHLHLRADDGIRTRDPHLGKVMRYQLRYIRAPRTRSSPGAKHDDSPRERAHTNFLVRAVSRLARRRALRRGRYCRGLARASLRRRSPSRRRSRGSVGERPLHTRKVAGSIPAGTTYYIRSSEAISSHTNNDLGLSVGYPPCAGRFAGRPHVTTSYNSGI